MTHEKGTYSKKYLKASEVIYVEAADSLEQRTKIIFGFVDPDRLVDPNQAWRA